ncbi:single-stranded DNA-binding protein [Catenulispora rubra]|uniref:single-stranded DNA-binding protein n=1 Tax=Catenulispora rubra TaxID=280293 RepID=UPI0018923AC5|nr:single-stranded DNA-binding protein [Catenulispora rubra]
MAGETTLTIIGNLTEDIGLKFVPSGAAVANFTVASTPRTFDKNTNEWKDGEALFMRCTLWRKAAENLAESNLTKGTRVMVTGALKQHSWVQDGVKRTGFEMDVEEIGVSLKFTPATVNKTAARSGANQAEGGWGQTTQGAAAADPWQVPATAGAGRPF